MHEHINIDQILCERHITLDALKRDAQFAAEVMSKISEQRHAISKN